MDTLDKDVLFEISWPGSTMGAIAGFGESVMEVGRSGQRLVLPPAHIKAEDRLVLYISWGQLRVNGSLARLE